MKNTIIGLIALISGLSFSGFYKDHSYILSFNNTLRLQRENDNKRIQRLEHLRYQDEELIYHETYKAIIINDFINKIRSTKY